MKKIGLLIAIVLSTFGCKQLEYELETITNSQTFDAGFADISTKTYVDEDLSMFWHSEDKISVFMEQSSFSEEYIFTGESGSKSGIFVPADDQDIFYNTKSAYYAIYPYDPTNYFDSRDNSLRPELPETQHYANDTFGKDCNTMVAVSSGPSDTFLPFRNVCGYLRVKLFGEGIKVGSIVLSGNNNEKISGEANILIKYGEAPQITMSNSATNSVTLDCGVEGVSLNSSEEEAIDFWFVIPPTNFEKGLTISIIGTDGSIMSKSLKKSIEIERNVVKSLSPLEVNYDKSENTISYTADYNRMISIIGTEEFGADLLSHTFTNGIGKIVFKSPPTLIDGLCNNISHSDIKSISIPESITAIKNSFNTCLQLSAITIPNSVTTISNSFKKCFSLEQFSGKFASDDGKCLIIDGEVIAFAPNGIRDYTVPSGVVSIGDYSFYNCDELLTLTIPEGVKSIGNSAFENSGNLKTIVLPQGVNSIGERAFYNCQDLSVIELKMGLKTIGSKAFYNCISLNSLTIPEGTESIGEEGTFYDCQNLKTVVLPESLKVIPVDCFFQCYDLTTVNIPSSITHIPFRAFDCTSLKTLTLPQNLTHIENSAFSRCRNLETINIPNSVEHIGPNAFAYCSKLKSINIPDGITIIEEGSFQHSALQSLTLPNSVKIIEERAFLECEDLATVSISNNLEEIYDWAFDGCISIREITLPNTMIIIGDSFKDCISLESINIPSGVKEIGSFSHCSSLKSITIPSTQTQLAENMFWGCSSLESITIPEGVRYIPRYTFAGCSKLKSINLPEAVESLGDNCFSECTCLTSISIPDNVLGIPSGAFSNCSSLNSVILPHNLWTIGDNAFRGCSNLTSITLPSSLYHIGRYAFIDCGLTSIDLNKVTSIYDYAFASCHQLGSISFPQGTSVLYLGSNVFDGCSSLPAVDIPELITNLPSYTFANCLKLASVVLPNTLLKIDAYAFASCNSLITIESRAATPPKCATSTFTYLNESTVNNMKLYVPSASIQQYKEAEMWKIFKNFYSLEDL